jgi:hypothetical protein
MSGKKFIELYSGNRNRELYPNPAQFQVPFASVAQPTLGETAEDPIVNGAVYYKFIVDADSYTTGGKFAAGSTASAPILDISSPLGETVSTLVDYYVGYYIRDVTTLKKDPKAQNAEQFIRAYNPTTLTLTLAQPLGEDPTGHDYEIYLLPPSENQISLPMYDLNFNSLSIYELAYNGYYLVYESPNEAYSNQYNSNIAAQQITYYDSALRICYFNSKFTNYTPNSGDTFTLRKSLPKERWTLRTTSYLNTFENVPVVGPLMSCGIITLPEGASTVDNFYKGDFLYFYSNAPYKYSIVKSGGRSQVFPSPLDLFSNTSTPMPGVFYPTYGAFYIKAYNGKTRQLSVEYDDHETLFPSYYVLGYDESSFEAENPDNLVITQTSEGYQATLVNGDEEGMKIVLIDQGIQTQIGFTYTFTWTVRAPILNNNSEPSFYVTGFNGEVLYRVYLPKDNDEFVEYVMVCPINVESPIITIDADNNPNYTIEWNAFKVEEADIINICTFKRDNVTPLSYSGSMTMNEPICYEVDLVSLTLPNSSLLVGSRISFYPYVFVEFSNATSPNGAGKELIYSNNPNSKRALFIATVPSSVQPILNTFISMSGGGMTQVVKMKPNDNFRFSVYLPDGTLFQTLETDFYSPYEPSIRVQIDAIFSLKRI